MLDLQTARTSYLSLTNAEQLRFLISFAHDLTIAARDTYEVGGTELVDGARMRRINEVQHRILAHAHALLIGRAERYPDHVLLGIILDDGQPHAKGTIRQTFQETWSAFERDTPRSQK